METIFVYLPILYPITGLEKKKEILTFRLTKTGWERISINGIK